MDGAGVGFWLWLAGAVIWDFADLASVTSGNLARIMVHHMGENIQLSKGRHLMGQQRLSVPVSGQNLVGHNFLDAES